MSKIAVVYWSGTGNTEAMARSVAEGAHSAGAEVEVLTAAEFGPDKLSAYDAAAEPMFSGCKAALKGKKIALFGSYGWGDGEWMRSWEATAKSYGALLACDSVICADAPDTAAKSACEALGKVLA